MEKTKKGAGRPKKYAAKSFERAVERYFNSIRRTVPARDEGGTVLKNDLGEELMVTQYVVPPTVTGLCLALGIDRGTWQNYADGGKNPEMAAVCRGAKLRMEAYLEEELLTRNKVDGIKFNLENNYGWKRKQEVELGQATRATVAKTVSYREKLAALRGDDTEGVENENPMDGS